MIIDIVLQRNLKTCITVSLSTYLVNLLSNCPTWLVGSRGLKNLSLSLSILAFCHTHNSHTDTHTTSILTKKKKKKTDHNRSYREILDSIFRVYENYCFRGHYYTDMEIMEKKKICQKQRSLLVRSQVRKLCSSAMLSLYVALSNFLSR